MKIVGLKRREKINLINGVETSNYVLFAIRKGRINSIVLYVSSSGQIVRQNRILSSRTKMCS